MKRIIILLLTAAAGLAQTSINAPAIGMVRANSGSLQTVVGVAGNFIVNDAGFENVLSSAFSGTAGLVKTDTQLFILDAAGQIQNQFDTPSGPALFAFDRSGSPAVAYYSGTLFQLLNNQPRQVNWTGNALSIALRHPNVASIVEQRDDGPWQTDLNLADGNVINQTKLTDVSTPLMLLTTGQLLFTRGTDLVLRERTGSEATLPSPCAVDSFEAMGNDWTLLRESSGTRLFALRVTTKELFQLPEVMQ